MSLFELTRWLRIRQRWLWLAALVALAALVWPPPRAGRVPVRFRSESVMCFPHDWNGCEAVVLQFMLSHPDFLQRVSKSSQMPVAEVQAGMSYQPEVAWDGRVRRLRFSALAGSPEAARKLAEALVHEHILWLQEEMSRGYDQQIKQLQSQLHELQTRRKQAYQRLLARPQRPPTVTEARLVAGWRQSLQEWEGELLRIDLELLEMPLLQPLEESLPEFEATLGQSLQKLEQLRTVFLDRARPVQAQLERVRSLQQLRQREQDKRLKVRRHQLDLRRQRCLREVEQLRQRLESAERRRLDLAQQLKTARLEQDWKALDTLAYQVQFQLFQARQERHRARREGGFVILQSASPGDPVEVAPLPADGSDRRRAVFLGLLALLLVLNLWDQMRPQLSLEESIVAEIGLPVLGRIPVCSQPPLKERSDPM